MKKIETKAMHLTAELQTTMPETYGQMKVILTRSLKSKVALQMKMIMC